MSNVISIGIIGALLIGATSLLYVVAVGINLKNSEVATGVVRGFPVSMDFRWMTLFQIQVPIVLLSGVFALLIGFAFQQIAANVEDPSVSGLAMMCAWMYFVSAFLFLATGPLGILHLATILRKERRD